MSWVYRAQVIKTKLKDESALFDLDTDEKFCSITIEHSGEYAVNPAVGFRQMYPFPEYMEFSKTSVAIAPLVSPLISQSPF